MAYACMYYVGNLSSSWSDPRGKYSRGTAGGEIVPFYLYFCFMTSMPRKIPMWFILFLAESSHCEILCARSIIGNNKILRFISHGTSSGWRKWGVSFVSLYQYRNVSYPLNTMALINNSHSMLKTFLLSRNVLYNQICCIVCLGQHDSF